MQQRVLRAWAADAAEFAVVLARREPAWGSTVAPIADGVAVLCGPGMFVNAAMAVGLDRDVSEGEFDEFEQHCSDVGVTPAFELSPSTRPDVVDAVRACGYVTEHRRAVLRRSLDDVAALPPPDPSVVIESATEHLDEWRETSARGWGHDTAARRRASDAFAGAACEVDGDGFVLARDAATGRPIGCASLTVRDDIATLGAMSTVPEARRRGVQAALVHHRLRVAAAANCVIATTSTAPGSASERNLRRHGFRPWFLIEHATRSSTTTSR